MERLIPLILLLLAALAALELLKFLLRRRTVADAGVERLPFRRKDYLLSRGERAFYEELRVALNGSDTLIFAKVRLLDLLWLPKGTTGRRGHLNRVMSKHVDFVLCDRQNLRPLLVIELDDKTHDQEDRQTRDAIVDRVLGAAGLPILHMRARAAYAPREIAQQIERLIGAESAAATARRR